jgi:hypothetical protein
MNCAYEKENLRDGQNNRVIYSWVDVAGRARENVQRNSSRPYHGSLSCPTYGMERVPFGWWIRACLQTSILSILKGNTLLSYLNHLDRHLEILLSLIRLLLGDLQGA